MNSLENIKEGDDICLRSHGKIYKRIAGRCTKTQILVGNTIFMRRSGYPRGLSRWEISSHWISAWTKEHEQEQIEQARTEILKRKIAFLDRFRWKVSTIEQVDSVIAAMVSCGLSKQEDIQ